MSKCFPVKLLIAGVINNPYLHVLPHDKAFRRVRFFFLLPFLLPYSFNTGVISSQVTYTFSTTACLTCFNLAFNKLPPPQPNRCKPGETKIVLVALSFYFNILAILNIECKYEYAEMWVSRDQLHETLLKVQIFLPKTAACNKT